jgi:hypothetical protein
MSNPGSPLKEVQCLRIRKSVVNARGVASDGTLTIKTRRNWYEWAAVRFGLKDRTMVTYRNGPKVLVERDNILRHICFACV